MIVVLLLLVLAGWGLFHSLLGLGFIILWFRDFAASISEYANCRVASPCASRATIDWSMVGLVMSVMVAGFGVCCLWISHLLIR